MKWNNYAKFLVASIAMLMLHFQTMFAVTVEYSLTTHVDGRTISQSVNLNAGANLEGNMPQKFWRAYTTYKYYSDAAMTQEITEVPAEDATVYVDYVFDSPFVLSDTVGPYWYHLRSFYANGLAYYYYTDGTDVLAEKQARDGGFALPHNASITEDNFLWAFYGDGYYLNIRNKADMDDWLGHNLDEVGDHLNKATPVMKNSPMDPGWQLFLSIYEENHIQQFVLGVPQENDELSVNTTVIGDRNMSGSTSIVKPHELDNKCEYTDQAVLDYSKGKITWCLFFGTMKTEPGPTANIWHVEYRVSYDSNNIIDRYFYEKEVTEKPVDYYFTDKKSYLTYEYYHDEAMTEPWDPESATDLIPTKPNTIVYVRAIFPKEEHYVTDHWITLVLPYDVDNLAEWFGTAADNVTPAVRVQEYDGLTIEEYPYYTLHFSPTDKIEANKPYLFKADEILANKYLPLALGTDETAMGDESLLETIAFNDPSSTRPDVYISMTGTYEGENLVAVSPNEEGDYDHIYFYFGYNAKYDKNNSSYVGDEAAAGKFPYNFYQVKSLSNPVAIPQNRCYFKIYSAEDQPVNYLQMGYDSNTTGMPEIVSINPTYTAKRQGIYHINGQLVSKNATSLNNLPKGMYIVNGEKVIIK